MSLLMRHWLFALIMGVLAVLTVGLATEPSLGFAGGIATLLTLGLAFLFGLTGLVCLCLKRWGHALRCFTVVGVASGSFAFGILLGKHQINQSFTAAAPVLDALETHRDVTGDYPDRLDRLVPKFLPEVPRSKLGYGGGVFTYRREASGFVLSFETNSWTTWSYLSEKKDWTWSD